MISKHLRKLLLTLVILFSSCATFVLQKHKSYPEVSVPSHKEIAHTFYLIGDAGNAQRDNTTNTLKFLESHLSEADKQSTLLFLGDNIYPKGLDTTSTLSKHKLQVQLDVTKNFKGKTIFIPGNHDWYSGLEALKNQERMVESYLGKNSFLPENGCPIDKVEINKDLVLLIIDTHWYVTNWNSHPKINDKCDIKTRKKFFEELERQIKKTQGKRAIIALHHPVFTQGSHGGNYSFKSHLKPLPVLGTLKNILRKTTGISNADTQHKRYRELSNYLITLAQQNKNLVFVSGHDHNLQYIVKHNTPQIISGSGSKVSATKLTDGGLFSYGKNGFAKLIILKDGSAYVEFFDAIAKTKVYQQKVFNPYKTNLKNNYATTFPPTVKASVYPKEIVQKSRFYKFLWGDRYRKYFGTNVTAKTVDLDTLYGGLTPVRKGGGHQSKTLRMVNPQGKEYVMRAIKKNAVQYLQTVLFKDQYIQEKFKNTYTEKFLLDVFSGSHPFAPFTIADLSEAAGILHTKPLLYYIPKQKALDKYNSEFGDELYMIEERTTKGHSDLKRFGFSKNLISTDEMFANILEDDDYLIDQKAFLRARLFDILIGDWDRHGDQWRWAEFKKNKKTIYKPVPRDRDQAFSIMDDGFLLTFASRSSDMASLLQSFDGNLKNTKSFNLEPFPLDLSLLNQTTWEDWSQEVDSLKNSVSDDVIEKAFSKLPREIQGKTIEEIKSKLKIRRSNLKSIAQNYYKYFSKLQIIRGTHKDDLFEIERHSSGKTTVKGFTLKNGKKGSVFHHKTYNKEETKEIWMYGLDDNDVFEVKGKGSPYIKLRLIGGQNKDTYTIQNGAKVLIYDFKSKKNVFTTRKGKKKLRDTYEQNVYDYKKPKTSNKSLIPLISYNPDDAMLLGFTRNLKTFGFERNPFTYSHKISGGYYTATSGIEIGYTGEFANVFGNFNLRIDTKYTTPNFTINFFGYGNQSRNPEDDITVNKEHEDGRDYNRIRLKQFYFYPSLVYRGQTGATLLFSAGYEAIKIDKTPGRYIESSNEINTSVFNTNKFLSTRVAFHYKNANNPSFSSMGMETNIELGYKTNLDSHKSFGYLIPSISFNHKLNKSESIVFATKFFGHINFGDNYEFYQAASIGANNGLRSYRKQRFTGKSAYFQSTDIRFKLSQFNTSIAPMTFGFYTGFDYGKVWHSKHKTMRWNTSYGGGIFVSAVNFLTLNVAAFYGKDELRFGFKMGFDF